MGDAKRDSIDELEASWWADWWKADYSWTGLARKNWEGWSITPSNELVEGSAAPEGARPATLQDYWRDQANDLIEGGGKSWTRAHLPPKWMDGTPTGKANWGVEERQKLATLIRSKLDDAAATEFAGSSSVFPQLAGADRRAQLLGVVFPDARCLSREGEPPTYVNLGQAAFLGHADLRLEVEGHGAFSQILFASGARVSGAFRGTSNLSQMLCRGFFAGTPGAFRGDTTFNNAVFGGACTFYSFGGAVDCGNARFDGPADFASVRFAGDASFVAAQFNAQGNFSSALFDKLANFQWVRFAEESRFDSAKFFAGAFFNAAKFEAHGGFSRATFEVGVEFRSVRGARFDFEEAVVLGRFWFSSSTITGKCFFNRMSFVRGEQEGSLFFEGSCFKAIADFDGVIFPKRTENFSGAFVGCRFEDWIDFRRTGTHWIAALDEAIIEDKILLDDPDEVTVGREFRNTILANVGHAATKDAEVSATKEQEKYDKEADIANRRANQAAEKQGAPKPREVRAAQVTAEQRKKWRRGAYEERLKELEGGCRAVKVAMGRERDEVKEQRYYRFQLMARRRQAGVPFWEKVFSALYAASSDYGASMTRPILAMLLIVLAFGGIFWSWSRAIVDGAGPAPISAWASGTMRFDPDFFEALRFSASRLLPFGAFGGDPEKWPWLSNFMVAQGAEWGFWIRLVASIESVFALVLAFLFALAVRRRFQMA